MTEWRVVESFPGYSVSEFGEVRREANHRPLRVVLNQQGVAYVGLVRDRRQYQRSLALLVARAFIEQPSEFFNTPINMNGDRLDCSVANLTWRPRWFSIRYHRQFKERYRGGVDDPVRDLKTNEVFPTTFEVAVHYGLLERDVVLSIYNRTYTWPGYHQFDFV